MVGQVAMKKWAASVVLLVPAVGSGTLSAGTADPPRCLGRLATIVGTQETTGWLEPGLRRDRRG